ncbi:MAG: hypothetical protein KGJ80_03665 [Chloroflexota bacterium]|nr:hypothetical protein [Chloroflexota bacterium]
MRKDAFLATAILLTAMMSSACAPASPTQPIAPSTAARSTAAPVGEPSAIPTARQASATPVLPVLTPDTPIPTTTPAPPTPVIPAGLYVTTLDVSPDPPTRGTNLEFVATFANTTGVVQNFRWLVYIYRSDNLNTAFGQTSATTSSMPLGANPFKSLGFWKLSLGGPCENFIARVAWLDPDNRTTPFLRPDGHVLEKNLTVCAPGDLPTATPASGG